MKQDDENAAIVEKVLSGARWATVLRLIAQSISWISTIVVVRFISASDYGLNAMLEVPLELLLLLSTFGLDAALVRSKQLGQEELRSVFGWLLLINGLLFLAYFFGGVFLAAYFNEPKLELLAKVLAFIFLLVPFRVIPNALLDRDLKFKLKAKAELIASIVSTIVTVTLAVMGAGIWALVTGMILNRALLAFLLMAVQPWFTMPSLKFAPARGMIAFGGTMALASAVALTANMLPALIAGPKLGPEMLGIFAVAIQFALLPLAKVMPVINPIIFPAFSKFQGQRHTVAGYYEKSLGIAALALLPIMVGTACIAEEFVHTILGDKWLLAVVPLTILSLAMPFRGVTSFTRQVLGGMGHADLALKSTLITLVLFFPTIWIGVNYEVIGIAAAIFITEPIVTLATVLMSKRAFDTSLTKVARNIFPAVMASTVMVASILFAKSFFGHEQSLIRFIVAIVVGAGTYVMFLRVFFPVHLETAIKLLRGK